MTPSLRGAAVAAVAAALLVLGFPGLDHLPRDWLATPEARAAARERPIGHLLVLAADANRLRGPLEDLLAPIQRPLRLAQSWALYSGGPARRVRVEVAVDGEVWYRSGDPTRTWQWPLLRSRKIRPVLQAACQGSERRAPALAALLWRRAVASRPSASGLVLRCTSQRWSGGEETETHAWTAP